MSNHRSNKEMASSDTPTKGDEQVQTEFLPINNLVSPEINVETVTSSESTNKRKRESADNVNNNVETKPAKETIRTAADTKQIGEKHVADVETTAVKEVEMKDAESVEIEMQDAAEVAYNNNTPKPFVVEEDKSNVKVDNETASDLNASEGGKEADEGKVGRSENSTDDQKHVLLGEVATLLKQVEESDTKAKLEVEVKVKKLVDHGDNVNENIGQLTKQESNPGSG